MYVNNIQPGVNSKKGGAKKFQVFKPFQEIILAGSANGDIQFGDFNILITKTINILRGHQKKLLGTCNRVKFEFSL
jgi:hypothetical protein